MVAPFRMTRRAALLGAAAPLGGCEAGRFGIGESKKTPIPGERIAVMQGERMVEADPRLSAVGVRVPEPNVNNDWPQPGGTPGHAVGHVALAGYKTLWRSDVGSATGREGRVVAPPIIAEGRVFVVDARSQVSCLDAEKGKRIWRFDTQAEGARSSGSGGGAAFENDRLYVTTGYGQVIALVADTGKELWRTSLTAPIRSGPTVGGGRVFAVSIDNQIHCLDATTGRRQWAHSGITETAGLYGSASPALSGNTVIAPFSSGEIFALRVDNGRVLWGDSLAGVVRSDAVSSLADIRGFPVVDRGLVIAASHGGRMAGIDLRSGERVWDQNIGSQYTPWVVGEFIFVTTVESELVCLMRRDGRVRWVQQLQRFRDERRQRGRVIWTGPLLVSDTLFIANSLGEGLVASYQTGELLERISLPGPVVVPPVVAAGTLYLLTDEADLVALR